MRVSMISVVMHHHRREYIERQANSSNLDVQIDISCLTAFIAYGGLTINTSFGSSTSSGVIRRSMLCKRIAKPSPVRKQPLKNAPTVGAL
jgi:hypothetical protein